MPEAAALCAQAVKEHRQGRLDRAEALYRSALSADARHIPSLQGLGAVCLQKSRLGEAAGCLEKAAALAPNDPSILGNLGFVLNRLGRAEEAITPLRRAVELAPASPAPRTNLAIALMETGRLEEAQRGLDQIVARHPELPEPYNILGSLHLRRGDLDAAVSAFGQALALRRDFPEALNNLGNVLSRQGQHARALESYRRAVALAPGFAAAHFNCGTALAELGRHGEAVGCFARTLEIDSRHAGACNNMGNSLLALGRAGEARAAFERALAISPGHAPAHLGLGISLTALGHLEEARAAVAHALERDPALGQAAGELFRLSARLCIWDGLAGRRADLALRCREGQKIDPFAMLHASDDPALQLLAGRNSAPPPVRPPRAAVDKDRMRVGFLSADFCEHPVAYQVAELIERLDRGRAEICGLCIHPSPPADAMRTRLTKAFDRFAAVGHLGDDEIAAGMIEDGIDIAVDLTGHTRYGRLGVLARRPAPVAAAFLGYSGTTGAEYVDYVIADAVVAPSESAFSEKIVRMPHSFMPADTTFAVPAPPSRAEAGLPPQGFVFCSFNQAEKLTPEMFAVWMRLLAEVPGSVLWLSASAPARPNLCAAAAARGIAAERIVFAGRVEDRASHLARLALAGLYLDAFPYGGHTTSNDCLRAGVPVVTMTGRSFASRVAASMVTAAGLPELVAADPDSYAALALALARDPVRLASLRERLARPSALFDMAAYARAFENALETMWRRKLRGEAAQSFSVD